jgi:hypothetical protein
MIYFVDISRLSEQDYYDLLLAYKHKILRLECDTLIMNNLSDDEIVFFESLGLHVEVI